MIYSQLCCVEINDINPIYVFAYIKAFYPIKKKINNNKRHIIIRISSIYYFKIYIL